VTSRSDIAAARGALDSIDHEFPLEQLARSTSTRFQLGFARMTMHLLPELEEVVLEASADGLRILAKNEPALALPGEVIRQIHAENVAMDAPRVRFLHGDPMREPIMWVRVAVRSAYAEDVIQDLVARDAEIEEVDWVAPLAVVRARAALQRLLGYPQTLAALTNATGELRMWLSHYAPMPPDPGKAA
jgi:hypothetical protein